MRAWRKRAGLDGQQMPAPAYAPGSHLGLKVLCLLRKSSGGWEAVWLRVPGASTSDGEQARPAQLVLKALGEERFPLKYLVPSEILKILAFGRNCPELHLLPFAAHPWNLQVVQSRGTTAPVPQSLLLPGFLVF